MFDLKDTAWAGSLSSLETAKAAESAYLNALAAGHVTSAASNSDEDDDKSVLLTVVGNVGVIAISGSLINADIPESWAAYVGVTTYPMIQRALIQAVSDANITKILLDINSPGGAVSGLVDTADLLSKIDKEQKPVYTYTGSMMASAGYWLGSSARRIESGRAALVGSIGVITTHMEYTEMLKKEGISATVFRAGKYKALGQPVEKLTEAAADQITDRIQSIYTLFIDHVAAGRGVSASKVDSVMAQGREFVGQAAVDAGLTDQVSTFETFLASLQEQSVSGIRINPQQRGKSMAKASLTEVQLAALQEGGIADDAPAAPAPIVTSAQKDEQGAAEAAAAESAESAAATPAPAVGAETKDDSIVTFLKDELREAQATVRDQHAQIAQLTASLKDADAVIPMYEDLVRASVNRLEVALGSAKTDLTNVAGHALLAQHDRLQKSFHEKFKVGGVAAVATEDGEASKKAEPLVTPAALNAIRKGAK